MARAASALDISTNPKPRGRPVSRSVMRETFSTVPCLEKRARTDSSVDENGRLPTYSLVTGRHSLLRQDPTCRARHITGIARHVRGFHRLKRQRADPAAGDVAARRA